jgi:hypothetical protein
MRPRNAWRDTEHGPIHRLRSQIQQLARPHLGSRTSVRCYGAAVCVNRDTRVALRCITRNGRKVFAAGLRCATACNFDLVESVSRLGQSDENAYLSTFGIELRRLCLVESKEFVTNQVVTRCKRLGDRRLPVQVLQHLRCTLKLSVYASVGFISVHTQLRLLRGGALNPSWSILKKTCQYI